MNSQILISCGENQPLAIDEQNSHLFFDAEDCDADFKISVDENNLNDDENITIESNVRLYAKSIHITGNKDHTIYLKPPNSSNTSGKQTYVYHDKEGLPDETGTRIKTEQKGDKEDEENTKTTLILYPNPTDNELNIESVETILSYTISDVYGNVYLQDNTLTNNIISVASLQAGLYIISLQTTSQIITKTFNKN